MYRKILVPLDGSHTSRLGLQEAIRLAKEFKTPAQLRLLHVVDDFPMLVEMSSVISFEKARQSLRDHGHTILNQAMQLTTSCDVQADLSLREVTGARIARAVVDEAAENGCDLIVMGTHGRRGLSRLALGSDADLVVGESPIPVLLVRGKPQAGKVKEA